MIMTRRRRRIIWTIVIGIPVLLIAYMLIEPLRLRVTHVTISSSEIPASFDGVTIAFLADMHRALKAFEQLLRILRSSFPVYKEWKDSLRMTFLF